MLYDCRRDQFVVGVFSNSVKKLETLEPTLITQVNGRPLTNVNALFSSDDICIVPRKLAERDANVRHIIPYVVIRNNRGEILAYPRKGKEDRIHRQWSVGFGGHMSPGDLQFNPNSVEPNLNKSIEHCAIRELQEELPEHSAEWHSDNLKFLGIVVHDDSKTDVPISYVHLGAIYSITVDEDFKPSSMEEGEDKSPLTWITPASRNAFRFEHWARALLDYFGSPVIF